MLNIYVRAGGERRAFEWLPTDVARLDLWFDEVEVDFPEEFRRDIRNAATAPLEREEIVRTNRHLDDIRDEALTELRRHNAPPVFYKQGGTVTEVYRNEKSIATLRPVSPTRMEERLSEVAKWYTVNTRGFSPAHPDPKVAKVLIETPELHLPAKDASGNQYRIVGFTPGRKYEVDVERVSDGREVSFRAAEVREALRETAATA